MYVIATLCFVALASALPDCGRSMHYNRGPCVTKRCEEGTYKYESGCGPLNPEPTYDNPTPVETNYDVCDYFACYCLPPTVRDTSTKKCVLLDECPPIENLVD